MIPPYSPSALRALIARMGISQRQAARLLGVSERTMRCWIAERHVRTHVDMPYAAWRLLNLFALDRITQHR